MSDSYFIKLLDLLKKYQLGYVKHFGYHCVFKNNLMINFDNVKFKLNGVVLLFEENRVGFIRY